MFGLRDAQDWMSQGEAQVKAYIGQFLSSEQQLLELMRNSNVSIAGRANQLYAEHKALESQAQGVISRYNSGSFTPTLDDVTIGMALYNHINATNELLRNAGQMPVSSMFAGIDTSTLVLGAGILVGVYVLLR